MVARYSTCRTSRQIKFHRQVFPFRSLAVRQAAVAMASAISLPLRFVIIASEAKRLMATAAAIGAKVPA
jgi:hypothetical protein